jgi:hypothetical protein
MAVGVSNVIQNSFPFIFITLLPQAVVDASEIYKAGIFMHGSIGKSSIQSGGSGALELHPLRRHQDIVSCQLHANRTTVFFFIFM